MRSYALPLGAMLATQVAAAAAISAVPVLAPEMARALDVDASLVGVYTGVLFAAATVGSAASGTLIARLGAVRTNQLAVALAGTALLVAALPSVYAAGLAALLLGAGYGPNTPSSSEVLARTVPPRRRALAFSLKQSGAPIGGMLAGATLPLVVAAGGWQAAIAAAAGLGVLAAIAVEPLRRRLDAPRPDAAARERVPALASMRFVLGDAALRRLTLGGFLLMVAHGCFQTFYVAYLVDGLALSLALAGGLYATLQAAGAIGRVALGWLVDRLRVPRAALVATSLLALGGSVAAALFEPGVPTPVIALVSVACGLGSSGWYGVFLAEVARLGSAEGAGLATGGALVFVYTAIVGGPIVIAAVVGAAGGYAPAFTLVAILAAGAAFTFARAPAEPVG